jgi:hypothetical protein
MSAGAVLMIIVGLVRLMSAGVMMMRRHAASMRKRHQRPMTQTHESEKDRQGGAGQCDSRSVRAHAASGSRKSADLPVPAGDGSDSQLAPNASAAASCAS